MERIATLSKSEYHELLEEIYNEIKDKPIEDLLNEPHDPFFRDVSATFDSMEKVIQSVESKKRWTYFPNEAMRLRINLPERLLFTDTWAKAMNKFYSSPRTVAIFSEKNAGEIWLKAA